MRPRMAARFDSDAASSSPSSRVICLTGDPSLRSSEALAEDYELATAYLGREAALGGLAQSALSSSAERDRDTSKATR